MIEQEKKVIDWNEGSLNKSDRTNEFNYLDQLKWLIKFNLYTKPTLCENNFCETIAWYIDCLQKENEATREQKVQELINFLKDFQWTEIEKLYYIDRYFNEKKIVWLETNWRSNNAKLLKLSPHEVEVLKRLYKPNNEWKIEARFVWIITQAIPERYRIRFRERWLEAKVMAENRQNFVNAMRKQNEEAEKLKKDL